MKIHDFDYADEFFVRILALKQGRRICVVAVINICYAEMSSVDSGLQLLAYVGIRVPYYFSYEK